MRTKHNDDANTCCATFFDMPKNVTECERKNETSMRKEMEGGAIGRKRDLKKSKKKKTKVKKLAKIARPERNTRMAIASASFDCRRASIFYCIIGPRYTLDCRHHVLYALINCIHFCLNTHCRINGMALNGVYVTHTVQV